MERSAARGRYREITPYLLPTNEMSNKGAILLTADELVNTNKNIAIKAKPHSIGEEHVIFTTGIWDSRVLKTID